MIAIGLNTDLHTASYRLITDGDLAACVQKNHIYLCEATYTNHIYLLLTKFRLPDKLLIHPPHFPPKSNVLMAHIFHLN